MKRFLSLLLFGCFSCVSNGNPSATAADPAAFPAAAATGMHAAPTEREAMAALRRATRFFREHASAGGGYVYQLSSDLRKREGEGKVGSTTAWVQPPGTPSVGLAYLEAALLTGDEELLQAAKETAMALVRGQLQSGGWDSRIEYAPADRKRYAYRVDENGLGDSSRVKGDRGRARNVTTFDDDKTQSAIRFLMRVDTALGREDATIHEATLFALEGVLAAQFSNGAWPQRFSEPWDDDRYPALPASYPEEWSRTFPKEKYDAFYTLNDNTMSDLVETTLEAWQTYDDTRFLRAAERAGDFLLLAQMPEPQPGWAQQYDREMHPAWARKFEPPAICGGESQGVMRTLIHLYRRTAEVSDRAERFLRPVPKALAYYRQSLLPDGRLARFYELRTNRPLFLTMEYELTYSDDDLPTHYAFVVGSKLDRIEADWKQAKEASPDELWRPRKLAAPKKSEKLAGRVREVIDSLDSRGAWVEKGRLRYHGKDDTTSEVIRSETFAANLRLLAGWVAASRDD